MEIKEILLVDARAPIRTAIASILQNQGYMVMLAPDIGTAAAELNNYQIDLLIASLAGFEGERPDFLRQTKRRFPQIKVMVAGDPQTMARQTFQEEVDGYLLVPSSPSELCRRVNHCLNQRKIVKPKSVIKRNRGTINEPALNSLRLKLNHINNTLFSFIANINNLIYINHNVPGCSNLISNKN